MAEHLQFLHTVYLSKLPLPSLSTLYGESASAVGNLATIYFAEIGSLQVFRDHKGRKWKRGHTSRTEFVAVEVVDDSWEYWTADEP